MHSNITFTVQFLSFQKANFLLSFKRNIYDPEKIAHLTSVRYYIKSLWAEENHWLSDHFAPAALLCKLRSKTENKYFLELILASLAGLSQPFMS